VEEDGDILIVPRKLCLPIPVCTGIYLQTLNSGTYDEVTAINSQFILQGNSDGTLKISEYSYIYATCEPLGDASAVRQKNSSNVDTQNSQDPEASKKMLACLYDLEELSSEPRNYFPDPTWFCYCFRHHHRLEYFFIFIFSSMDVEKRSKEQRDFRKRNKPIRQVDHQVF
jgi:hypothetical protein